MTDKQDADVAEAERLHKLATPGPWTPNFDDATKVKDAAGNSLLIMMQTHLRGLRPMDEVNRSASSIAALHNIAPILFASYHARQDEVARLREALKKMCDEFEDATYDTVHGTQSKDRKSLIQECRTALAEERKP